MKNNELEMISFEQIKNEFIGKIGTTKRTLYEHELQKEILGALIKKTRLQRKMTQVELGKRMGMQKSQIVKLESNASIFTLDTILKVFNELNAKVNFNIELLNNKIKIA